MRWKGRRKSTHVDDRRGQGPRIGRGAAGAGLGGGAILVIFLLMMLTGRDPSGMVDVLNQSPPGSGRGAPGSGAPPGDEAGEFVSVVLASTEEAWEQVFRGLGRRYQPPTLVLFDGAVGSACGYNSAAVGPFYCPGDKQVYMDLSFFRDLHRKFAAPGDFAQAYVIAHEVGHHVQKLLGVSDEVHQLQRQVGRSKANELSVRLELQADCLAGVWGHHAGQRANLLEAGDIEEGLRAAAAIGDDRMQRRAGGYVSPESWTHGSSEQRVRWLKRGLETGDVAYCDTFETDRL